MPHLLTRRFAFSRLLALLLAAHADVAFSAEPPPQAERWREGVLRMTEFADTILPGVLGENNITLHFRPKFSDLRANEYMRFPVELRYGLSARWELTTGLVPFTPNPFNRGREHRWGPGEVTLGARYDLGRKLLFFDETTLGLEARVPIGRPPIELNDHYTHVKPFVTTARTLRAMPNTTFYTNLAYDRSVELSHRSAPPVEVMRRNIIEVAPGLLFRPSEFAYFVEYRWRHIAEETDNHRAHAVQVGTIWDVPLKRTAAWKLPGKWQIELAGKAGHETGRERDLGLSLHVNWRTTLREVLERGRAAPISKPES